MLGLDSVHDFAAQGVHLFLELRPEVLKGNVSEVLQLVLFGEWSDHGATVTLFEEAFQEASDTVFLVDGLAETFLVLKSLLEVVF